MRGAGVRGPGRVGGHHHHHHHHGGGLMAGMMVGAAVASRRNRNQQNVVVVQSGSNTGQTYPQQQQPLPQAPLPPPSDSPQKKQRLCFTCCCACLFVLAVILCATLIDWPGTTIKHVILGSQQLDKVSGLFMGSISTYTTGSDAGVYLYTFDEPPPEDEHRTFSTDLDMPTSRYVYTYIQFDFLKDSIVDVSWNFIESDCGINFMVIEGVSRFDSFRKGYSTTYHHFQYTSSDDQYTFHAVRQDSYFFIFDNPYCSHTENRGNAFFDVDAVAYTTTSAIDSCLAADCDIDIPYGSKLYYVLDAPLSGPDSTSVYMTFHGLWYAYFALYAGLFMGICLCIISNSIIKKSKDATDEESRSLLEHGTINTLNYATPYASPTVADTYPPATSVPYPEASTVAPPYPASNDMPSAPSSYLPPYDSQSTSSSYTQRVYKYDPMTGQPL